MRRPRSFWEARVAELAQGRTVERIARQHGVLPGRLRWWRWRLATPAPAAIVPTRMIEILPATLAAPAGGVRILIDDIVIELPSTMTPAEIGRIARAACAPC